MAATNSRFAKLLDLASQTSSEQRRVLLREVTDLFFDTEDQRTERETHLFGDVIRTVAADMQDGVLVELAQRFAQASNPPVDLMRDLAHHRFEVAEHVLTHCKALTDDDLIGVITKRGQDHVRAIARRETVSHTVSNAIVDRGDDDTVDVLVRNAGAKITRGAMEKVIDRALANDRLHEGVVGRADVPVDLLNELYFAVETRLREAILERNAQLDPQELDVALMRARERMRKAVGAETAEMTEARALISRKTAAGGLDGAFLVSLHRDKKHHAFLYGLAEMTGVDVDVVRSIVQRKDLDALAMLCRASNVERPLFVTIAMLIGGGERATAQAEDFGKLYLRVPVEAAQRALRFYKVRRGTDKVAA